jgi:tripartite-type tricarboxylate transporter receptor subunit TctC
MASVPPPGAGGTIGSDAVAKAEPDGYDAADRLAGPCALGADDGGKCEAGRGSLEERAT